MSGRARPLHRRRLPFVSFSPSALLLPSCWKAGTVILVGGHVSIMTRVEYTPVYEWTFSQDLILKICASLPGITAVGGGGTAAGGMAGSSRGAVSA